MKRFRGDRLVSLLVVIGVRAVVSIVGVWAQRPERRWTIATSAGSGIRMPMAGAVAVVLEFAAGALWSSVSVAVPGDVGEAMERDVSDAMEKPQHLRPETVEAVFHRHYVSLVRSLTLVAGDQQTAEDAVQEAFTQAHLRWSRISQYRDPVAWVRRVALNRLFNVHRGRRRRRLALDRLASSDTVVPDEAELVSGRVAVAAALQQLTPRQRAVVALFYLEDLPLAEVASVLGCSEATVKSQLHRAREVLRKTIEVSDDD